MIKSNHTKRPHPGRLQIERAVVFAPHGSNSSKRTSLSAVRKGVKRMIVASVAGQIATK